MTYQEIKSFINTYIVQNGVGAITGSRLNTALNALADYYGFDSVVVTTLPAGSEATVNVQGRTLELGIPKGADGRDGQDGQNAVNPFKGWYTTDNIPTIGQEGDYCNVTDTQTQTVTIYRWDTMQNEFVDTGEVPDTATGETFASGETLQEVAIDDSGLESPTNPANPTQPVLAQAKDIMPIKAATYGVEIEETKFEIPEWHPDGKSAGFYTSDGRWNNSSSTGGVYNVTSSRVLVQGFGSVRFLGFASPIATTYSYAFTKEDGSFVDGYPKRYDADVEEAVIKEYVIQIPEDAVYFVFIRKYYTLFYASDSYCFGRNGQTLLEKSLQQARESMKFASGENLSNVGISSSLRIGDDSLILNDTVAKNVVINNRLYVFSENDKFSNFAIDSDTLKWAVGATTGGCLQIPIKEGSSIEIKASTNSSTRFAFLQTKATNPTIGDAPDFVFGTTLNIIQPDTSIVVIAPTNCYLYIQLGRVNSSFSPYPFMPQRLVISSNSDEQGQYENTYVEAPFYKKVIGRTIENNGTFSAKAGNVLKFYTIDPLKHYKIIYEIKSDDTDYNRVNYYSTTDADGFISGFGKAEVGQSSTEYHVMDDLSDIPSDAKVLVLSYPSTSNCALMVAADSVNLEQKLKSNCEFLYFVSKIRKNQLENEYESGEHENVTEEVWSAWALNLPETYSQVGRKTPIYAAFHGTHGFVTTEIMSYESWKNLMRMPFNDAGIATLDIHGYGVGFGSSRLSMHNGCPEAIETARLAFSFCKQHFNVCDKMVLGGLSMGGAICMTYANTYPCDVLAVAVMAPENLIYTSIYVPDSYVNDVAAAWGYSNKDEMRQDNASHLLGYAPLCIIRYIDDNGNLKFMDGFPATSDAFRALRLVEDFPVPLMIWHGTADTTVYPSRSTTLVNAIRRGNGNARIRLCTGLEHALPSTSWVVEEVIEYVKTCFAQ